MGKIGKTLKNLLYAGAFATAASFLPSCEKDEPPIEPPKDTTPPKINIISPLEQKVYDSDTISFEWKIIEDNFKSAWYSIDNEQTKTPIIEKSGKKDLILPNASYNIVVYADDNSNNFSNDSVLFSVNKPEIINIDVFTSTGKNATNYNQTNNRERLDEIVKERTDWDWLSTIPYSSPNFICDNYGMNFFVNGWDLGENVHINLSQYGREFLYNNYKGDNVDSIKINGGSLRTMNELGIPVLYVSLSDTSHYSKRFGHAMNGVVTGITLRDLKEYNMVDVEHDFTNIQPGEVNFRKDCDQIIIGYFYTSKDKDNENHLEYVPLVKFRMENGVSTLFWENTDPKYSIRKER